VAWKHGRARQKPPPYLALHDKSQAPPPVINLKVGNLEHQDAKVWSRARVGGRGRAPAGKGAEAHELQPGEMFGVSA